MIKDNIEKKYMDQIDRIRKKIKMSKPVLCRNAKVTRQTFHSSLTGKHKISFRNYLRLRKEVGLKDIKL